jgi:hypothetical protein
MPMRANCSRHLQEENLELHLTCIMHKDACVMMELCRCSTDDGSESRMSGHLSARDENYADVHVWFFVSQVLPLASPLSVVADSKE